MLQLYSNEWEEVYKTEYSKSIYNENRQYVGNTGDFYVRNVYFSNLGNNGVIILNSADIKSLISTNTFDKSSRNDLGGSIYIKQGQSSIRKVCSFGSQASGNGKFCHIWVPDDSTKVNEVCDSSITYSNRGVYQGYQTIHLLYGNNSLLQNNITRNYCQWNAALAIGLGKGSMLIKYSIIDENYAHSRICWIDAKPTLYHSLVFINNSVSNPDSTTGLLNCNDCDTTFENCFISGNKQNGQYLFGITSSYFIKISNSFIDTLELLYQPGRQVTIEQAKEILIELHPLSTELCPGFNYFVYLDKANKITEHISLQSFEESIASLFS